MRKAIFWFGLMAWFAFPLPTLAERVLVQGELVEFSSKAGDSALAIGCRPPANVGRGLLGYWKGSRRLPKRIARLR